MGGLEALGTADDDVEGQVFHLPVVSMAPRELVSRVARARGAAPRLRVMPRWAFRLLAPFVGLFGELRETMYQWERPFLSDGGKFRRRFPDVAAPLDVVIRETAAAVDRHHAAVRRDPPAIDAQAPAGAIHRDTR